MARPRRDSPQPDVPVREREHRLGLRKPLQVKLDLAQRPRVDQERRMLDHDLLPPTGSALAMTILGDLIMLRSEGFSCRLVLDAGCREVRAHPWMQPARIVGEPIQRVPGVPGGELCGVAGA